MSETTAPCACGAQHRDGHHAVAVDPEIKRSVLTRLRRIEGQVRGLQKMVEEERYCADVLTQVASVHEALRGVGDAWVPGVAVHRQSVPEGVGVVESGVGALVGVVVHVDVRRGRVAAVFV